MYVHVHVYIYRFTYIYIYMESNGIIHTCINMYIP